MIVSKANIITTAFEKNFDTAMLKDSIIQVVEWERVLTLLGADFYDDVVANPNDYTTLISTYLTPYISWSVKSYVTANNHFKNGNKGVQVANGLNETASTADEGKRIADDMASRWKYQTLKYLKDNASSYPLWEGYAESDSIINKIIIL